jgi:hypothetical protein
MMTMTVICELTEQDVLALQAQETALYKAAFKALPASGLDLERPVRIVTRWANSYTRMQMVLTLRPRMEYRDWLVLLGRHWNCCDNIRDYTSELRRTVGTRGPLMRMMTTEEQTAYAELPDRLTIYRGCSAHHLSGASWSLDQEIARSFPAQNRYRIADPVLVVASVLKQNVLALLLSREEQEIVTFSASPISAMPIGAR